MCDDILENTKRINILTPLDMKIAVSAQLPLLVYYLLVLEYIMFAVVCQETGRVIC